MLRQTILNARS